MEEWSVPAAHAQRQSAGVLFVRVATFGAFQRVALQIQGLIVRRDTGIADSHGAKP